jgi:hypothetical protein
MERSDRGPSLKEIMLENGSLRKALQDTTSMLALICYMQEDKSLTVSVKELAELPAGSYVDVSFDKTLQAYTLRWQPADAPELPKVEIKSSIIS